MKKQFTLSVLALVGVFALATPALAATISTQMDIGTRGGDVTTLQQTFAADASIYPEGLVTGCFGVLSSAAVKRFQANHGVVSSGSPSSTGYGRVGPATIAKFNQVYGGFTGGPDNSAPVISSIVVSKTNNGQSIMWNTNESATGIVYYSTSPFLLSEAAGFGAAPGISGTNVLTMSTPSNTSNSIVLSNVAASTTYSYIIRSTDAAGNVQITWPSVFTTY